MAHQALAAVDVPRVDAVDLPHQVRQVGGTRVQHEVLVAAHRAVGQHLCVEAFLRQRQVAQPLGPVAIVGADSLAPVAARRQVVDGEGEFDAQRAGNA